MEFPKFSRSDTLGWIMRCERYFELNNMPEEEKVKMASICLDEKAWSCHMAIEKTWFGITPTWEQYVILLKGRFRPTHEALMGNLMHLRQKGSLAEFNGAFDSITCKLDFSQEYIIEAYMEGMTEEYSGPVRLFKPRNLQEARSLACMQEITLEQ